MTLEMTVALNKLLAAQHEVNVGVDALFQAKLNLGLSADGCNDIREHLIKIQYLLSDAIRCVNEAPQ